MLFSLFPLIKLIKKRRISVVAFFILIAPPMFWFYISWKATGNWLACFVQRQEYHDWLLRMNPSIAQFSTRQMLKDVATLLVSSDVAVLIACFVAAWFVIRHLPQIVKRGSSSVEASGASGAQGSSLAFSMLAPVLFFCAFFA